MVASGASVTVDSGIYVGGNVKGNIVSGNDNIVYNVHNDKGALVYQFSTPSVRRHRLKPGPPRPPSEFIGRAADLQQLSNHINSRQAVVVYGRDGIGKTTLAKQAANGSAAKAMRDGVIYLQGLDEKGEALGVQDATQLIFDALYQSNPPLKVTQGSARTYLSERQPLVVLNRFEFSSAGRSELADLLPKGALVLTNRNAPGDDGLQHLELSPLTREESIQLFTRKAGITLDERTHAICNEICDLLDDVPLALSKAANLIGEKRIELAVALRTLKELRPPSQGDAIQAAIERSYGLAYSVLSQMERQALAIAAAAPGVSVDRPWLDSLSAKASQTLEPLELLQANSPRLRVPEGMRRVIQAGAENIRILREQQLGQLLFQLQSRSLDFKFVEEELGNILGHLQWAYDENLWPYVIGLGRAVDAYLTLKGLWDAWERVLKQVLVAAENLQDVAVQAWALHQLGTREISVGTRDEARDLLVHALELREARGDRVGAAYTRHNLNFLLASRETRERDYRQPHNGGGGGILPTAWILPILIGIAIIAALLLHPWLPRARPDCPLPEGWQIYRVQKQDTLDSISQRVAMSIYGAGTAEKVLAVVRLAIQSGNCLDANRNISQRAGVYVPVEPAAVEPTQRESFPVAAGTPGVTAAAPAGLLLELTAKVEGSDTFNLPGQTIDYSYVISNGGSQSVEGPLQFKDDKATVNCPEIKVISPNERVSCTGTYTVTQADLDLGSVTDTASVWSGDALLTRTSFTMKAVQTPELTLFKAADPKIYDHAGQTITYRYLILNSGNVTLSPIELVVSDDHVNGNKPFNCGPVAVELAPNQGVTCAETYSITEADVDARSVTNKAVAMAYALRQRLALEAPPATTTIHYALPITLTSTADPETYDEAGQTILFTYTLQNNNHVALPGVVTIKADKATTTCPPDPSIPAGGTVTCKGEYKITQADVDAGSVTDNAAASVGGIASEAVSTTLKADQHPGLEISNIADPTTYDHVEQNITYQYIITNSGNVTLDATGLEVRDDRMGVETSVPCSSDKTQLAPGEKIECKTSYTISEDDTEIGAVTNSVTVSGLYKRKPISSQPAVFTITYICPSPPAGWAAYIIRSGDTLAEISSWYPNTTAGDLERANCMGLSTVLFTGNTLYVPYLASITGTIFADPDGDGVQERGETAFVGFTVPISGRNIHLEVKTNQNGVYTFTGLPPGIYSVLDHTEDLTSPGTRTRNFGLRPVP